MPPLPPLAPDAQRALRQAMQTYARDKRRILGLPFLLADKGRLCGIDHVFDVRAVQDKEHTGALGEVCETLAELASEPLPPIGAIRRKALQEAVVLDQSASGVDWAQALISRDFNPLVTLEASFEWTELDELSDVPRHLKRLDAIPLQIDLIIENLIAAIGNGLTLDKVSADRLLKLCANLAAQDPSTSLLGITKYAQPFPTSMVDLSEIRASVQEAVQRALDALGKLSEFLSTSYLPKARDTPGIYGLPGYEEAYENYIHEYTFTKSTALRIHDLGLSEISRIEREMSLIIESLGETGTVQDFAGRLRDRQQFPQLFEASSEEAFLKFTKLCASAFEATRTEFTFLGIGHGPVKMLPVVAVASEFEDTAPVAFVKYAPSRFPSHHAFEINAKKLTQGPSHQWEAIILNLFYPGEYHQYQNAFTWSEFDLFGEVEYKTKRCQGWAHYAETCGKELGFYADPLQHFGHLERQLLNAVLMVVDTGIHTMGWTVEKSVNFIQTFSAYTANEAEARELVFQCCESPGKALAPKMGELRIRNLRNEIEKEFDFGLNCLVKMGFNQTVSETEFFRRSFNGKGDEASVDIMEYAIDFRVRQWRDKRDN
ncbi:hypothetical protein BDR26DRAFT_867306 [Obelidium mucronatum]|nr:hypothetical protein BDR26DRAFT_867306 [Obelidium mucronatum]